jgi:hypothetical protein
MSALEKAWDAITTVIKMNDKVEALSREAKELDADLRVAIERIIRLEARLDAYERFGGGGDKAKPKRLPRKTLGDVLGPNLGDRDAKNGD